MTAWMVGIVEENISNALLVFSHLDSVCSSPRSSSSSATLLRLKVRPFICVRGSGRVAVWVAPGVVA